MEEPNAVTIENVGPIEGLTIPIPYGGGVVVLKGRNGAGKTTALDTVRALTEEEGKLNLRRGALRGSVEGFGGRIAIKATTKRSGDVEVETLEGADPSALVDPGIKDPEAADARRIAAMCLLADVEPAPEMFDPFLEALDDVSLETINTDIDEWIHTYRHPLPEVVRRVKAALQEKARGYEAQLSEARGGVTALEGALQHQGEAWKRPEEELSALETRRDGLIALEAEKRTQRADGMNEKRRAKEAKEEIAGLARLDRSSDELGDVQVGAEEKLKAARVAVAGLILEVNAADIARRTAILLEEQAGALEAIVEDAADVPIPTAQEIDDIGDRLKEAREDIAAATRWDELKEKREELDGMKIVAVTCEAAAEELRKAATDVGAVLSEAVEMVLPDNLEISDEGRLIFWDPTTDGEGGVEVFFSDLSPGERWRMAMEIAIAGLREPADKAILVIPQGAWEGLDPTNRAEVDEIAKQLGVVIITAEATDGDLRVEEA